MLVPIKEIQINPGRREVEARDIEDLAKSIAQVGLLNPHHHHTGPHPDSR